MQEASNIFTILQENTSLLTSHKIKEAKLDAEVLLSGVLNIKRSELFMLRDKTLSHSQYQQYKSYINRRIAREPVSYILGNAEFMGINFIVDKNVLIPRQETEILVEQAIIQIKKNSYKNILDIGTGSGCIPVSICKECNNISAVAVDINPATLEVAKQNAINNCVINKINFKISNVFDNILNEKFDIITSNPPYITEQEFKTVEKELLFEPKRALVAQDNGLYFYKIIANNLNKFLNLGGMAFIELNSNLSQNIKKIFEDKGYRDNKIIKDYSNLDRVLVIKNG